MEKRPLDTSCENGIGFDTYCFWFNGGTEVNEHTGFHEVIDGKRFNPECLACQSGKITLEELAKIRDEAKLKLDSIFTQIQILTNLPPRLV